MTQPQLEVVEVTDSPANRVLEAVDLAVDVTKLSADVLHAVSSNGERFSQDELTHLEAALVRLRADVARCERWTAVQLRRNLRPREGLKALRAS